MRMKTSRLILLAGILLAAVLSLGRLASAAPDTTPRFEYASIRWDGRDNTHLVRPDGRVEFLSGQFKSMAKPGHSDERTFYLNVAINQLAKEGFELAAMTEDEVVMKRLAGQ
jgi:hypothetical protein